MALSISHKNTSGSHESKDSDFVLWGQVRDGFPEAMSTLYKKYVSVLYPYGIKIYNDATLVEDAIHDVFVDLWRLRDRLVIKDSLKFYLISSFRRRLLKALNKNRKILGADLMTGFATSDESFETQWITDQTKKETFAKLKSEVAKLSARQMEVIYLKFYQNLDYTEISEIMDISVEHGYNLVSKAISNLKKSMLLILLAVVIQLFLSA